MPTTSAGYDAGVPGFTAIRETAEASVLFQTFFQGDVIWDGMQLISSTAVDAGNTPTGVLRPGLVMGRLDSDGSWINFDATATNGAQEAQGVLVTQVNMLDYTTGSSGARLSGVIVIGGKAKVSMLQGFNHIARHQLAVRGFRFDDNLTFVGSASALRQVSKAANYTVVSGDHGVRFLATTGAVVFTLPAIAPGLYFEFLNAVDATMTVASAEGDNVVASGDLSADSIAFATAANKIGGFISLEAIYIGSTLKWLPTIKNASVTIATIAT